MNKAGTRLYRHTGRRKWLMSPYFTPEDDLSKVTRRRHRRTVLCCAVDRSTLPLPCPALPLLRMIQSLCCLHWSVACAVS